MNAAELTHALEQWPPERVAEPVSGPAAAPAPPPRPSPVQHVSAAVGSDFLDDAARGRATQEGLLDPRGQLHCWRCHRLCPWHVSLHCTPCLNLTRYQQPERDRQERERWRQEQEARRLRQQEQTQQRTQQQRRSFRDD